MTHAFLEGLKAPLHSSHRGGAALYPENTLFAFRAAVERHRTDLIELDVHATRDGEVVVAHDPTLDRCTDAHGAVAELDWATLRDVDAAFHFSTDGGQTFPHRGQGIRIPRLREVLEVFPTLRLNVEVKDERAIDPMVALVRSTGCVGRLCLGSEHDALAERLVHALPDGCFFYPRDALAAFILGFKGGEVVDDPRYTVLDMPLRFEGFPLFDRALAEEAARRGKWINVWTVDDPAEMKQAIADGVGGIMTDRPDLLRQVIDATIP